MKILTIVGARPQFVKAAALSREIAKNENLNEIIVHTGQHFDSNMSDIFSKEMEIPKPHYNLNINSLNHGAMTGRMLEGIEEVILKENIDLVLVYGDTNSTLAGALAAKKLHRKVAHIEAGLRSFNMNMPEEINRILSDRISDYLFCPTETAVSNLKKEGYENIDCKIILSGDVMQDAALYYAKKSEEKSSIIRDLNLQDFVLCTIHRQENTDNLERLTNIVEAINEINESTQVVLPLHPRTKKIIEQNNLSLNAKVIDPVGYFDMLELLKNCKVVMTDSGGLQKEAFFFEKNCITLRDETEWVELTENEVNILAGADKNKIISNVFNFINKPFICNKDLYGGGNAASYIAQQLKS